MSRHLAEQEIERYLQRSLSGAELLFVCDHLEKCEACRKRLARESEFEKAFTAFGPGLAQPVEREPFHLPVEQLLAYANGTIDDIDAEIIQSHLGDCLDCTGELQELRESHPAPDRIAIGGGQATFLQKLRHFWLSPLSWMPIQAASVVAVIILTALIVSLQNRVKNLSEKLSELGSTNSSLEQQVATLRSLPEEFDRLRQAYEHTVSPASETVVALYDGGKLVTLDRDRNLAGLDLAAKYEELVKTMLTTRRAAIPSNLFALIGERGTTMGVPADDHSDLLSPVGTAVSADRPTMRWTPVNGASVYIVNVFDSAGNQVASSGEIRATRWSPRQSLKRGEVYSWEVTAVKDGKEVISPAPPVAPAKFRVLDEADLAELRRAEKTEKGSHLVMGAVYAQAGLLEDAEREFKILASGNPHSTVARKLLESIQFPRSR